MCGICERKFTVKRRKCPDCGGPIIEASISSKSTSIYGKSKVKRTVRNHGGYSTVTDSRSIKPSLFSRYGGFGFGFGFGSNTTPYLAPQPQPCQSGRVHGYMDGTLGTVYKDGKFRCKGCHNSYAQEQQFKLMQQQQYMNQQRAQEQQFKLMQMGFVQPCSNPFSQWDGGLW